MGHRLQVLDMQKGDIFTYNGGILTVARVENASTGWPIIRFTAGGSWPQGTLDIAMKGGYQHIPRALKYPDGI